MKASTWARKFEYANEYNDLKSLEELCFGDMELFNKMKTDIVAADNARRRDIQNQNSPLRYKKKKKSKKTNKYSEHDYMGGQMSGYLDEDSFFNGTYNLNAAVEFSVGSPVRFIARDHIYTGETGVILEVRGKMALVSIISRAAPKHKVHATGRRTSDAALVRVPLTYLEKINVE